MITITRIRIIQLIIIRRIGVKRRRKRRKFCVPCRLVVSERMLKSWETEQNFSILFSKFFYYNRLEFLVIFINENDVIIMYETTVASFYFYFFYCTYRLLFIYECVCARARAYTSGVSPLPKYRECYFHRDIITTLDAANTYVVHYNMQNTHLQLFMVDAILQM